MGASAFPASDSTFSACAGNIGMCGASCFSVSGQRWGQCSFSFRFGHTLSASIRILCTTINIIYHHQVHLASSLLFSRGQQKAPRMQCSRVPPGNAACVLCSPRAMHVQVSTDKSGNAKLKGKGTMLWPHERQMPFVSRRPRKTNVALTLHRACCKAIVLSLLRFLSLSLFIFSVAVAPAAAPAAAAAPDARAVVVVVVVVAVVACCLLMPVARCWLVVGG